MIQEEQTRSPDLKVRMAEGCSLHRGGWKLLTEPPSPLVRQRLPAAHEITGKLEIRPCHRRCALEEARCRSFLLWPTYPMQNGKVEFQHSAENRKLSRTSGRIEGHFSATPFSPLAGTVTTPTAVPDGCSATRTLNLCEGTRQLLGRGRDKRILVLGITDDQGLLAITLADHEIETDRSGVDQNERCRPVIVPARGD